MSQRSIFRRAGMLLALVGALLLLGCAGTTEEQGGQQIMLGYKELLSEGHWQPIAIAALLISFFIVAIAYMLAEFLRRPELNAWAKNEFYETLISAFLLASVFFFVGVGEETAQAFTMGENHIEWGMAYLENVKVLLELEMYPILLSVDLVVSTFATWNYSYPFELSAIAIILGTSPVSGFQMLGGVLVFMLDSIGMFIAVVLAQMAFLEFVEVFALGLFLPLGIVLRTFPVTRKVGSTLIALAFTAYFVYPLTLALNQEVFDTAYIPLANRWSDPMLANPNVLDPTNVILPGIMKMEGNIGAGGDVPEGGLVTGTEDKLDEEAMREMTRPDGDPELTEVENKLDNTNKLYTNKPRIPLDVQLFVNWNLLLPPVGWTKMMHEIVFRFFGPWVMQAAVLVLVLPIINVIITITFFRSLSLAIGGEPQIMGLTRIV